MYEFDYRRPGSLADALEALKSAPDGSALAGGQTLLPTLKQRLASPSDLIDLAGISELQGIAIDGDTVVIGAMTRHADVAASPDVQGRIPALAALAGDIGDRQVRNRGTIGGSVANNDPAADYPAACLGLGATIVTSAREVAADDFFTGLFETALDDGELVTAVRFPTPGKAAYMKFKNPASRYAIVGVFVAQAADGARVAVTGAGAGGVFRVADMERALTAEFAASALEGIAVPPDDLNSDIHASAEYRAHLVGVMARRAVAACG
ncbi:MAG: xanthine dehydrogenase family protein subunit M [Alphaproteobacteria bacterium]|nr:xanthine dehydrogenase family protein subunit M [Alphaproteobacteria bacterium]